MTRGGDHLLERASETLSNPTAGLAASNRIRLAAWYARAALEQLVIERLDGLIDPNSPELPMAHRLICLRSLDPAVGKAASYAWWGLSRICHQHAFELTPTEIEVRHLLDQVLQIRVESRIVV